MFDKYYVICKNCQVRNPLANDFCNNCGEKLVKNSDISNGLITIFQDTDDELFVGSGSSLMTSKNDDGEKVVSNQEQVGGETKKRFCTNCGCNIDSEKINFCPLCGVKLENTSLKEVYKAQLSNPEESFNADFDRKEDDEKRFTHEEQKKSTNLSREKIAQMYNVPKFKLNLWTILFVLIELIIGMFGTSIILHILPFLKSFPLELNKYGGSNMWAPTGILITCLIEYYRQKYLYNKSIDSSIIDIKYGERSYGTTEDLIDRDYKLSLDDLEDFPGSEALNVDIVLDGMEDEYVRPNEEVYCYSDKILFYSIDRWVSDPVYVTENYGGASVTSDWSSHKVHEDWKVFGNGELYVTDSRVLFYSRARDSYEMNIVTLSFNEIYLVQGHFDLGDLRDCILIRSKGQKPQNFVFHLGESNSNEIPKYGTNWNHTVVSAIKQGIIANNVDPRGMGRKSNR